MSEANIVEVKTDLPNDPSQMDSEQILRHLEDIKAAVGTKIKQTPKAIIVSGRRPQSSVLSYGAPYSEERASFDSGFKPPIHDLGEIARAVDTESYLARSIQKHREYILKEGWNASGSNPDTVKYVKDRLFQIALATDITTDEWIRELVTNLVTYSTAFLVKKRDREKSLGLPIRLHGKYLDPIAGLFPMDTVSVKVKQNISGRPIKWKQEIDGRVRFFDSEDVLSITIDKKSGFIFGTPYCVTVLDDIRALRRLEELVEMVAHKHIFPLFHVTVGTETKPAQDIEYGDGAILSEVDIAKQQILDMPMEGGLVTSERFKVEIIGAEGEVLDLSKYIEHFKQRVMSGLRLSPLDLGQADTGNKATAQVVNRNLVDAVKDFQRVIADQITAGLFDLILLEGGFDLIEENRVLFTFPTADREEQRSQQQHGMSLFQTNAITAAELRSEFLKKNSLSPDEENDTWHFKFERPMMEMQLAAKKAAASGKSGKDGSIVKSVGNKVRPQNQHGKAMSKPTFPINDSLNKLFDDIKASIIILDNPKTAMVCFNDHMTSIIKSALIDAVENGVNSFQKSGKPTYVPKSQIIGYINQTTISVLQNRLKSYIIMIEDQKTAEDAVTLLDALKSLAIEVIQEQIRMADNYGFLQAYAISDLADISMYELADSNLKDRIIEEINKDNE